MTCIVALKAGKAIYWGADSCVTGYDTRIMTRPKIFQVGEMVFGGSGTLRMLQLIEYHLKPKKHKKKFSDMEYLVRKIIPQIRAIMKEHGKMGGSTANSENGEKSDSYFIIGYRGDIYQLGFGFSVTTPVEPYEAIGSGQSYALGAFLAGVDGGNTPKATIETALEAAEFFASSVRSPYHFYKQIGGKLEKII